MNSNFPDVLEPDLAREAPSAGVLLQAREERDRFFTLSHDMLAVFGYDGTIRRVNPAWERTLGWTVDELVGRPASELVHPDDWPSTAREHEKVRGGEALVAIENRYRCRDGSYRKLEWSMTPSAREEIVYASARDVTDRHRAETDLREVEERYQILLDRSPLAKVVYDAETGAILEVNAAAERLYSYLREEMLGLPFESLLMSGQDPSGGSGLYRHLRHDGTLIDVEVSRHPIVYRGQKAQLTAMIDVTDRQRLEQQFRQAQKMEAVGRLAGGVAHDFNNLLAVILSCTEFLLTDLPEDDARRPDVVDIRQAGQRAASLTRQLLAFSRKQVLKAEVLNLNDLVGDIGKLLKRLIGEDIHFVTTLHPGLGRVMADRGQMEQVLLNLAVNSRDAMPHGGSLLIETANVDIHGPLASALGDVAPGRYVVITVKDTGCGMDAETQGKIFEPFFTTKELGKGTGLGLSTVFGIVKQSGGAITVDSSPGRGATFSAYLPRIDGSGDASPTRLATIRPNAGSETILLVEDDEQVRGVVRRILRSRGYSVIEARDGGAALSTYERDPGAIDLVVTDLVIPGFDGLTVASELKTRTPRVKVLYMSGYTDHMILRHGMLEPGVNFLSKPFSAEALAAMVRKILDS